MAKEYKDLVVGLDIGTAKVMAVESAFAAVNVGDAHGAPPHTVVVFDNWRHGDYVEHDHPFDFNREYFPKSASVIPRVSVLNNADTQNGGLEFINTFSTSRSITVSSATRVLADTGATASLLGTLISGRSLPPASG